MVMEMVLVKAIITIVMLLMLIIVIMRFMMATTAMVINHLTVLAAPTSSVVTQSYQGRLRDDAKLGTLELRGSNAGMLPICHCQLCRLKSCDLQATLADGAEVEHSDGDDAGGGNVEL